MGSGGGGGDQLSRGALWGEIVEEGLLMRMVDSRTSEKPGVCGMRYGDVHHHYYWNRLGLDLRGQGHDEA